MLLERKAAIQGFTSIAEDVSLSGKILLISGEAGIGKTTLLEHMRLTMDMGALICFGVGVTLAQGGLDVAVF